MTRLSTGIALLDRALGGGLLPGTLTIVVGATGVGKSQLGLQWCYEGQASEQRPGAILDLHLHTFTVGSDPVFGF